MFWVVFVLTLDTSRYLLLDLDDACQNFEDIGVNLLVERFQLVDCLLDLDNLGV